MGLACAVLTGLTGGVGYLSMRFIYGKIQASTDHIRDNMAEQNHKMNQTISLRSLIQAIADAETFQDLILSERKLSQLQKKWTMASQVQAKNILTRVAELQHLKLSHLHACGDLEDLKKAHGTTLEEIRCKALNISDNTEFESTLAIESAFDSINVDITRMLASNDSVFTSTKAASNLHTFCYEIDVKIKEAYLTTDTAYIAYIKQEIATLLANVNSTMNSLPDNPSMTKIRNNIESLGMNIDAMFEGRIRSLNDEDPVSAASMMMEGDEADIGNIIDMIKTLASQTQDDTEFDGAMELEASMNGIRNGIGKMTKMMGIELHTIKTALTVRYICTQLDSKTKEALAMNEEAVLNFLKTEIITLIINANEVLERLPTNETTTSIALKITELESLITRLFESKHHTLACKADFKEVRSQINAQMDIIENTMIDLAGEVKTNAEQTMQECSGWVNQWQSLEIILVCGAFLLAVVISALVSTSVTKQLQKLYQGIKIAGEGDLKHKVDTGTVDEIGDLSRAFDGMTVKLATRENAFRESEQKFRKLFELSNDGIIIHGRNQKIIQVNKRMVEMIGFEKEYFAGKQIFDLHLHEERERVEAYFNDSDPMQRRQFDSKFIKSNGETIIVDIRSSLIDPKEGVFQSIVRDVTQQKRGEEDLKEHMEEVSEANKHLEVLVSNTTDRERKMVELKREINDLLVSHGQLPRYEAPEQVDELLSQGMKKEN